MTTITERFKAKLDTAGQEVDFAGFPLRLRYAPLESWIAHGRVPQYLASIYLQASGGQALEAVELPEQVSTEDAERYLAFKRDVIEFAAIEPKISFDDAALKGEISAADIEAVAPGLLDFIFLFAMRQIKPAKIETKNGEVSADALHTFRDDAAGEIGTAGTGVHGQDVQSEAVATAGAA